VIQKNWQGLIKPTKLDVVPGDDPSRRATIVAEPLERGFGLTSAMRSGGYCCRPFRARR